MEDYAEALSEINISKERKKKAELDRGSCLSFVVL